MSIKLDVGHCLKNRTGYHWVNPIKNKMSRLTRFLIWTKLFYMDSGDICRYATCVHCGKWFCLTHKEEV